MSVPKILPKTPVANFDRRAEAYADWCSCSKDAAAKIVAHDGDTFDATVKRVALVFIDDIERYLYPKEAA